MSGPRCPPFRCTPRKNADSLGVFNFKLEIRISELPDEILKRNTPSSQNYNLNQQHQPHLTIQDGGGTKNLVRIKKEQNVAILCVDCISLENNTQLNYLFNVKPINFSYQVSIIPESTKLKHYQILRCLAPSAPLLDAPLEKVLTLPVGSI